jgi:integrase
LIPIHSVAPDEAVVGYQYRPRTPRLARRKYEGLPGSRKRLDCPPRAKSDLANADVPLWITEGTRKADAAVSLGLCCISLDATSDRCRGPLSTSRQLRKRVRLPAVNAVGCEGVRFHDLRHHAATLAAITGATTKELMVHIGHASPDAALRYQHATHDRRKAIAEGINQLTA